MGSRTTITVAVLSSSLLSSLFPLLVSLPKVGFCIGFMARILLGILQALQIPAFVNLWTHWAPVQEKSRLIVSKSLGIPLGAPIIVYVGGYLIIFYNWKYVFWFAGVVCFLIGVLWHFRGS